MLLRLFREECQHVVERCDLSILLTYCGKGAFWLLCQHLVDFNVIHQNHNGYQILGTCRCNQEECCRTTLTQFSTRYELLRLGMGQEVAARRAFIATRGGLSWPSEIFCPPLSHLVLLNCWLKLAYYTTVIISGRLSACLLFQSNLAVSINIVKIIAWARSCRGGSWSCRGRCRRTGCDVFSRQLCRECSRLVATLTQTEDPWCLHKMFNSVWRAL